MSKDLIPSVSASVDGKTRVLQHRHSFQNQKTSSTVIAVHPVRRHNSLGKNRSGNSLRKPSVPDILEIEKDDEDDNSTVLATPSVENIRISFTKKTRKVSNISRTSKISLQSGVNGTDRGSVNYAYDLSTRSSTHGSMSSLPVIREQYCCCSRWTRLEKNLALIVAVLAIVIIALIIAIGIIAKQEGQEGYRTYAGIIKF